MTVLWTPPKERINASRMEALRRTIETRFGVALADYAALHRWSVEHIAEFWTLVAEDLGIRWTAAPLHTIDDARRMPGARWFEGGTLNFAEHLLYPSLRGSGGARGEVDPDRPAIIFRGESMQGVIRLSWSELRAEVSQVAAALRAAGAQPGDRVAGYLPNLPETIIAMLASASIGAIWSSCSPDFGVGGVLDRFDRIAPKVLFVADGVFYGGKQFDNREKAAQIVRAMKTAPARVVVVPYVAAVRDTPLDLTPLDGIAGVMSWEAFIEPHAPGEPDFTPLLFDHPLYIMYSSGTTGLPKCIVQSAGGILLNQLKEHAYHVDLGAQDNLFYFTTCGWMMWNWLAAALGVGATITLFDGSPFHPDPLALPRLAQETGVTAFGASAKYFAALEKEGAEPAVSCNLTKIRSVLSTGSPLLDESFEWIYRSFTPDAQLASISGGTDLNGCFVAGSPLLPVRRGEIQCRCLGMDVHAYSEAGEPVIGEMGELVCTQAFPSMPIGFWGDPDGSAYRAAYFERYPGIWHHGDFIEISAHGGVRISGRSDATLNPGGVRIGTAEIYRQVETIPDVADSIVIGQQWQDDVRVVLFVKMTEGHALDNDLRQRIRTAIRSNCSPRHVPAKIIEVSDIPYTISMKKVEIAVRDIVHGREVRNRDALKNPQSLELFRNLAELAT